MNTQFDTSCNVIKEMMNLIPDLELEAIPKRRTIERKTNEEHNIFIEKIIEENGGTLPCISQLKKNGLEWLNYMFYDLFMKENYELFKNLKQDSEKQATLEEWIKIAEDLAKEHGGILPSPKWIIEYAYCNLFNCMYENFERFSHIRKDESWRIYE